MDGIAAILDIITLNPDVATLPTTKFQFYLAYGQEETSFESFQWQNGTILASPNIHVALMSRARFGLNLTYG